MKYAIALALAICSTLCFAEPNTFHAEYVARFEGLPIKAKGIRELSRLDNGHYLFTSTATSMLGKVVETSEFSVVGNELVSRRYHYARGGLGKNKQEFLVFDHENGVVLHDEGSFDLVERVLDKLSYQLQLKLDLANRQTPNLNEILEYPVADGDRLKHYRFRVTGEEVLPTPAGEFLTTRLERVREDSDRQTIFWLAKDHDYLLVKLRQEEHGKGYELDLQSLNNQSINKPE